MNDQEQQPEVGSMVTPDAPVPPPPPPVKKITVANGEEVILEPFQAALVVLMDLRNGSLGIYDLQNCSNRATAKTLLNEALDHYRAVAVAASTVTMMAEIGKKESKKGGIFNPFEKRG
jgi:hypothetical protein